MAEPERLQGQAYIYHAVTCERCLRTDREDMALPIKLASGRGEIVATEWAVDKGWQARHGQTHCPDCAAHCAAGACPPQHPFLQWVQGDG